MLRKTAILSSQYNVYALPLISVTVFTCISAYLLKFADDKESLHICRSRGGPGGPDIFKLLIFIK